MGKGRKPDYSDDRGDEDYVWKKDEDDVKEVDDDDLDHDKLLKQETMKQLSESIKKILDMENDEVDAPMDGDHIAFTKVLTSLLEVISPDALSRTLQQLADDVGIAVVMRVENASWETGPTSNFPTNIQLTHCETTFSQLKADILRE